MMRTPALLYASACMIATTEACTDTPNWNNNYGYGCARYASGWCDGSGFAAGFEWTGQEGTPMPSGPNAGTDSGPFYNYPGRNCVACGKCAAPAAPAFQPPDYPYYNLSVIAEAEALVLTDMLQTNATSARVTMPGGLTVAAQKLTTAGMTATSTAEIDLGDDTSGGANTTVRIPISLLDVAATGSIMVVSSISPDMIIELGSNATTARAVLNMNVAPPGSSEYLPVANLQEPVEMTFNTENTGGGLSCAFWDEQAQIWSTDGVSSSEDEGGVLRCYTTHFTLFGAVAQGFISSFACNQAGLMSRAGYQAVADAESRWVSRIGSAAFWCLLVLYLGMLCYACGLDCRRQREEGWTDECFLIPLNVDTLQEEASKSSGCGFSCTDHVVGPCKDAVDDLMSNFFAFFGDVRNILEQAYEGCRGNIELIPDPNSEGKCIASLHMISSAILSENSHRQACSLLGVHIDDLAFMADDATQEELSSVLDEHSPGALKGTSDASGQDPSGIAAKPPSLKEMASQSPKCLKSLQYLQDLNDRVIKTGEESVHMHQSWLSFPKMVLRSFWTHGPFGSIASRSILMSSSMRAFFLILDQLSTLMIATLFFSATGGASSIQNKPECDKPLDFWGSVGKALGVAVLSSIISTVPLCLLASLHSRSFMHYSHEGCPEWSAQLRAWRVQDRMIWVIGFAYGAFAVHFVMLFFANVTTQDQVDWFIAGIIAFCEDMMVLPLVLGLALPILAFSILAFLSVHYHIDKGEMITRIRSSKDKDSLQDGEVISI